MPIPKAVWWLGAAGVGVWALGAMTDDSSGGGGENPEPGPKPEPEAPTSTNYSELVRLLQVAGLGPRERAFFIVTAKGEGNFSPTAHNGSASERAASAKAASSATLQETVARAVNSCGVPRGDFNTGSWSMFQLLAPYLTYRAFEILGQGAHACQYANPTTTRRPFQIVAAMAHAKKLQGYQGWKAAPTVGNLRLGWGAPSRMGYLQKWSAKLDKYRKNAEQAGLDPAVIDANMGELPAISTLASILSKLEDAE